MCSYRHERFAPGYADDLAQDRILCQLAWVLEHYPSSQYHIVKIFTSGSFFDTCEIPPVARLRIAQEFRGKVVIAETRPEFVQEEAIAPFLSCIDDGNWQTPLYCAIGLETTSDRIREKCIRKGFLFSDFTGACSRARKIGSGIKAYLLHKPLFLTEREAINDMRKSIAGVSRYTDLISMNPCTVQGRTDLEWYWKHQEYRPPYLWSVLAILNDISPVHVCCDPIGGGRKRGPHNCGVCDREIVQGIRDYSLNGDHDLIAALLETECTCKAEWQHVVDHEMPYTMPLTR